MRVRVRVVSGFMVAVLDEEAVIGVSFSTNRLIMESSVLCGFIVIGHCPRTGAPRKHQRMHFFTWANQTHLRPG